MTFARISAVAMATALFVTLPAGLSASHDGVHIRDAYVRAAPPTGPTGAAFMVIENHREVDERLIGVASDVAERVELHTHIEDAAGVMRMIEVKDGFAIPAGGEHELRRGGDHIMFMGLRESLEQGTVISVTLTFETMGDIVFEIPVDHERAAGDAAHGGMSHGDGGHGAGHGHGN